MTVPGEPGEPGDAGGDPPGLARVAAEVIDLAAIVRRLATDVETVTTDLEKLSVAVLPLDPESAPDPQDVSSGRSGGTTSRVYPGVQEWVTDYFLPTFRRSFGGEVRWCTGWQQHPEAVVRLEALWRSWEALRVEPTLGMITWLTQHLDPQLAVLLGRSGTFGQCTLDRHADWW